MPRLARIRPLVALVVLGCADAPSGAGRDALPPDSVVRARIAGRVDGGPWAGIVVGLLDPDGTMRFVSYGTGAGGLPLDERSVFEIGSATKTFTAAALADMAARGLVRLDQPVAELLPAGSVVPSRNGRQITLEDLATHRSGLPRMPDNFAPRDATNPYADYDGARLLEFLASYQLPRDVGAEYEYSNVGVGLLGYALALRDGRSYEGMVAGRLLAPLGMGETGMALGPELRARLAPGHDASGRVVPNWDPGALAGAGALRSTARDMLRWVAANLAAHRTPDAAPLGAALAVTHRVRAPTGSPNLSVGLAWHVTAPPATDTIVWHNGRTGGYASFVGFVPARRVGLVLLTNTSLPLDDLALELLTGR